MKKGIILSLWWDMYVMNLEYPVILDNKKVSKDKLVMLKGLMRQIEEAPIGQRLNNLRINRDDNFSP